MEYKKCCICGKSILFGNNPAPVRNYGLCCDECNTTKVIPARLKRIEEIEAEEKREENLLDKTSALISKMAELKIENDFLRSHIRVTPERNPLDNHILLRIDFADCVDNVALVESIFHRVTKEYIDLMRRKGGEPNEE